MQKGPALLPHPRLPAPPPPPPSLRAEPRKTEPTCDLLQGFKHLKLLRLQGGNAGGSVPGRIRESNQQSRRMEIRSSRRP